MGQRGLMSSGGTMGPAGGAASTESEGEVTWYYDRPNGRTDTVLFNKDGRVIQIQSFGYNNGGVTSRGIRLGDPVRKVYSLYGWTSTPTRLPSWC